MEALRLSRLLGILLRLQSNRVVTARELAEHHAVSVRTIYRDIRALEVVGVPVIGDAGMGYSLGPGYSVPPLMFTEAEVGALVAASKWVERSGDSSLRTAMDSAVAKVRSVLREQGKDRAELLARRTHVFKPFERVSSDALVAVQAAIVNRSVLRIRYEALADGAETERDVEPLAVYMTHDKWLMIGHCRLRDSLRDFRMDRIQQCVATGERYAHRPFSFDPRISE